MLSFSVESCTHCPLATRIINSQNTCFCHIGIIGEKRLEITKNIETETINENCPLKLSTLFIGLHPDCEPEEGES